MTRPTRFCRLAWIVPDIDATDRQMADLLGLSLRYASIAPDVIKVGIEEHGLEPIELSVPRETLPFMDGIGRFVEVALAVDDCDESYRRLAEDGILPSFTSPLIPAPRHEHLYARGFGGIPILVCTDGENEEMMAPFLDLEAAAPPKIGVCTMMVDSINDMAARLTRYFDMDWVETDPAGLGSRAVVGRHRVKLIEGAPADIREQALDSIIATEMMFPNHIEIHERLKQAGYPIVRTRRFASGREGWYFGRVLADLPLAIFHPDDEAEALGQG
jgi:hypothetical protein